MEINSVFAKRLSVVRGVEQNDIIFIAELVEYIYGIFEENTGISNTIVVGVDEFLARAVGRIFVAADGRVGGLPILSVAVVVVGAVAAFLVQN